MAEGARELLAERLKRLRGSWEGRTVTQRQVADALSASGALVSSWENASAIPPEDRLKQYARLFATQRSVNGNVARLLREDDLTEEEDRRRHELADELVALREAALDRPSAFQEETGALGGKFFHFPGNLPITILYTPLSDRQLGLDKTSLEDAPPAVQYAKNPTHPNGVSHLGNGDIDALLEAVGHIRAENPTAEVRWDTHAGTLTSDQLTGHVVVLGGADSVSGLGPSASVATLTGGELPVIGGTDSGDPEFGLEYQVKVDDQGRPSRKGRRVESYGPRFRRNEAVEGRPQIIVDGAPQLESDVALIVRGTNPFNASARLIICSGLFSRGTYGAVRAFTDAVLRARNERYLSSAFEDFDSLWTLIRVQVINGERTVTPDLALPNSRLTASA